MLVEGRSGQQRLRDGPPLRQNHLLLRELLDKVGPRSPLFSFVGLLKLQSFFIFEAALCERPEFLKRCSLLLQIAVPVDTGCFALGFFFFLFHAEVFVF